MEDKKKQKSVENTRKTMNIMNNALGSEKDDAEKSLDRLITEMKSSKEKVAAADVAVLLEGVKEHMKNENTIFKTAFLNAIALLANRR